MPLEPLEPLETIVEWELWFSRLQECRALQPGWNGYTAPVPAKVAISFAEQYPETLRLAEVPPTRVAPSAMGGIAITRKVGDRKVMVEFYNDGRVYALFADRRSEELPVEQLVNLPESFISFIPRFRECRP